MFVPSEENYAQSDDVANGGGVVSVKKSKVVKCVYV